MLVEIPDPEVILGMILAFIIGVGGLYGYYKIRPLVNTRNELVDTSQSELLEYYEKQLIDMKIRLDALEIQGVEQKTEDPNLELKHFLEKLVNREVKKPVEEKTKVKEDMEPVKQESPIPKLEYNDVTEHVLHLITNKAMTSRDIQDALGKSREHTSRLMKKLFDEGYVDRNTNSKPYTYSITEKGKQKISVLESNPMVA